MTTTRTAFASAHQPATAAEIRTLRISAEARAAIPGATRDDPRIRVEYRGRSRIYPDWVALADELQGRQHKATADDLVAYAAPRIVAGLALVVAIAIALGLAYVGGRSL